MPCCILLCCHERALFRCLGLRGTLLQPFCTPVYGQADNKHLKRAQREKENNIQFKPQPENFQLRRILFIRYVLWSLRSTCWFGNCSDNLGILTESTNLFERNRANLIEGEEKIRQTGGMRRLSNPGETTWKETRGAAAPSGWCRCSFVPLTVFIISLFIYADLF